MQKSIWYSLHFIMISNPSPCPIDAGSAKQFVVNFVGQQLAGGQTIAAPDSLFQNLMIWKQNRHKFTINPNLMVEN